MSYPRPNISVILKQNYFIIGILVSILLAEIAPWIGGEGGPLVPEITVKYLAVSLIFYISGLTLKTNELAQATKLFKLHIFIQLFTFVITPCFIQLFLFIFVMPFGLNEWILKGLITAGCMPPPVSSAVILTKSVGGNEAAAIFNSAIGSFLGILLTPILLLFHVGLTSTLPVMSSIVRLTQTVIFPILLGQLTQITVSRKSLSKLPLSFLGQFSLLYIIYTSFCDMFLEENYSVDAHHVLITLFLVIIIQMVLMYSSFEISNFLSQKKKYYSAQDIMAITFCSTHKSLTLGMPLLKTLYGGYSHLSQITLPLLIYHPVQLILGAFLVPYGQQWLRKHSKYTRSHLRP